MRRLALLLLCCSLLPAEESANPQQLFQDALAAQQRGDNATALLKYRALLRLHPEAATVRANLGAVLAELKRFDEAIVQYRAVLASDSKNSHVRMNMALAYQEKGDLRHAVVELETLHRSQPADVQAAILLGDCYSQLQRYADAVQVLSPLESARSDDLDLEVLLGSALIHSGKRLDGAQRVEQVAERFSNAEAYMLAGQARLDLDQYDLAQRDSEAALRLDPTLAGGQTLQGMVLEHMGDFHGAEAALGKALEADANDFEAHLYLGAILYFRRDLEGARLHLEHARQLQPKSTQARFEMAQLARAEGRFDEALVELRAVALEAPEWLQPHVELSALYYRLHRADEGDREKRRVDELMARQQQNSAKSGPRRLAPPVNGVAP